MPPKKKASPKIGNDKKDKEKRAEDSQAVEVTVEEELEKKTQEEEDEYGEIEIGAEEPLSPEEEIARLAREKEEQYDRLLRVQADFDNYRKRVQKERTDLLRYGAENALREILPVIDNIELAVESARNHDNSGSQLREGIDMILSQFFSALDKLGVKPIETVDHPFDPNKHDALMRVHAPETDEGSVVSEIRKGYYLHDKVLRPAQVTVGTHEKEQAPDGADEEQSAE